MALSSVSVVTSSLLLKRFKPSKTDWLGKSTALILTLLFTLFFVGFSSLSTSATRVDATIGTNSGLIDLLKTLVATSEKKIAFDGG